MKFEFLENLGFSWSSLLVLAGFGNNLRHGVGRINFDFQTGS